MNAERQGLPPLLCVPSSRQRVYGPKGQGQQRLLEWLRGHPWSSALEISEILGRNAGGVLSRAARVVDRRKMMRIGDGVCCWHYAVRGSVTGDDAIDRAVMRDRELAAMGEWAIRAEMERAVARRFNKEIRTCA